MKVKYIGKKSDPFIFIKNKVYDKLGEEHGYWRVVDETGEDYLYSPKAFEPLTDEQYEELMKRTEYQKHKCPICGETEFSMKNSGELCKVCGWYDFDDPVWNDGASEEDYKAAYEAGKVKYGDWAYFKK